ncbi:MAG TPA: class I SAM-dependent methyltransferase [Verrucomicrobiae bacterium]|nr:class I SAM-dependent methyltransferase [Verrucomicrobiae bacterium]
MGTSLPPSNDELKGALGILKRADYKAIQKLGHHLQPNDYYSPVNDCSFLDASRDLWTTLKDPECIDWRLDHQLEVAREVAGFVEELRNVPEESSDPATYYWQNPMWNNADALVQYGLVRSRKPQRYIEIGCGWSSLLLKKALLRNEREGATRAEVTLIEPYPRAEILSTLPSHWRQIPSMLQRAPLTVFDDLRTGDMLFFDGSHCAKVGSDVCWFFFRVLPRLHSGVLIHIHDIFYPDEYPEEWLFNRNQSFNEQYVLQAFLMHNHDYEVEIANRYVWIKRATDLDGLYKGVQPSYGCSFWMRKL